MEETNCNLCGSNDTEPVYAEKDRLMKLPGSFQLVRCRQCGLLYINPRPTFEEMGRFLQERWKGRYPVLRGAQVKQEQLIRSVYQADDEWL